MEIGSIRNGDGTALARGLAWFSMGLGAAELAVPHELARLIGVGARRPAPIVMRALGAREIASGLNLLIGRERPVGAWARVAGDVVDLALLAWAARTHCTHRERLAVAIGAVLGVTALDVIAGRRLARRAAVRPVTAAITIHRSPEEVYAFYCDLENLPRFMEHVESATVIDERNAHWVVARPDGGVVEWDAELVDDIPGALLSWQTKGTAALAHRMTVRLRPAPGHRGTEVVTEVHLRGPVRGPLAKFLARQQLEGDLRRLKQLLETGEVVRSDASIYPGLHPAQPDLGVAP